MDQEPDHILFMNIFPEFRIVRIDLATKLIFYVRLICLSYQLHS
jgi:hypothetical protein